MRTSFLLETLAEVNTERQYEELIMTEKIGRVNWVKCPKCTCRYYVGPQFFMVDNVPAVCPKCRHEFDPKLHLVSRPQ